MNNKVFNFKVAGITAVVLGLAGAATLYNQGASGLHTALVSIVGGVAVGAVVGFIFKKAVAHK